MIQTRKAIQMLMTIGVSAGAIALVTACNGGAPTTQANANGIRSDVTDVQPIAPAAQAAYQPPLYDTSTNIPTVQQPVMADRAPAAAVSAITPRMSSAATATAIGEKTHTVRHGETLFSIAKASYGDGKAWKKIVSANPGLSPSKLKVGQVLSIPQS